jgi:uncharacterized protein YrrD
MKDGQRTAHELLGLAVFSIAEGKRVGEVARLLVHRASRRVTWMEVTSGAFSHGRYLHYDQIRTIGGDALMIESEAVLDRELHPEELKELDTSLSGRPVLSQHGERLGGVVDYVLDAGSGKIIAFRFETGGGGLARLVPFSHHDSVDVPDAMVITLGADALVVPEGVADVLHSGEAELQETGGRAGS